MAFLRCPPGAADGGFVFHPGLLDACFQVAGAASDEVFKKDGDAYMTVGFDSFQLRGAVESGVWCHGSLRSMEGGAVLEGRLRIYDEGGRRLAEVRGACFKRVPAKSFERLAGRQRGTSSWFYSVGWQARPWVHHRVYGHATSQK